MIETLVMVNIVISSICGGVSNNFCFPGMAGAMMMEIPSNPLQNMDPQEYLNK